MLFSLICLATYFGLVFLHCISVLATYAAGRMAGVDCDAMGVGIGPRLLRWRWGTCENEWRLIPISGFARLRGMFDELPPNESPPPNSYPAASAVVKVMIVMVGPVTQILIGLLFLTLPTILGARQLAARGDNDVQLIVPRALPSLGVSNSLATMSGQLKFADYTVAEFAWRLVTFQSLSGWGGMVGFVATTSAVALISPTNWLTCLACALLFAGGTSLVPLPPFTGGQVIVVIAEAIRRRPISANTQSMLGLVGMALAIVILVRMLILDVSWLWVTLR